MPYQNIEPALSKLLDQYQLLKYPGKYYAFEGQPFGVSYPGMEQLIPTMSLICLTSILDDALEEFIQVHRSGKAGKLQERIELLDGLRLLTSAAKLHAIRDLRNACAHQPEKFIGRAEFEQCYADAKAELQHLGIVA